MKKIAIIAAILLLCAFSVSHALEYVTANQITVGWDAVAPIQPTDIISYIVYTKHEDGSNVSSGQEVTTTQSVVTFSSEGKYVIGVATKRVTADGEELISDINWSDVNGEYTPVPFVVKYYVKPDAPKGLSRQ